MSEISKIIEDLKQIIVRLEKIEKPTATPQVEIKPLSVVAEKKTESNPEEFEILKDLVHSNDWPNAINPNAICNEENEDEKRERAAGIIEMMVEKYLPGTKFLDFGCGEGHMAMRSTEFNTVVSIGYDIKKPEKSPFVWEDNGKFLLTTDFEKVKNNGPYDVILLFDVIDHIVDEDLDQVMKKIYAVSQEGTRIYIKCHPWCTRHGGHLYHQLNKAFAHVVFTDEELVQMGYTLEPAKKILFPLNTYRKAFEEAGFYVYYEHPDRDPVEKYFSTKPIINKRIKRAFNRKETGEFPSYQLEQSFVDYILTVKKLK